MFLGWGADEILNDINTILAQTCKRNDCASDALPNHILVPIEMFGMLVTWKDSDDSKQSILTYIRKTAGLRVAGDLADEDAFIRVVCAEKTDCCKYRKTEQQMSLGNEGFIYLWSKAA